MKMSQKKYGTKCMICYFLLFEISADFKFDLDSEWDLGKKHKQKKYISNISL